MKLLVGLFELKTGAVESKDKVPQALEPIAEELDSSSLSELSESADVIAHHLDEEMVADDEVSRLLFATCIYAAYT
jgi:hypothetical protein